MNNANIRRYGRELKKSVRGFRLRKQLMAEFERSLAPLLEELPSPSYEDLVDAFGPPEHLAEMLLHEVDVRPLSWKAKAALAVGILAILFVVGFGISSLQNIPEEGALRLDAALYTGDITEKTYFIVDDPFTHSDSHWDQPRNMAAYQVEIHNTGTSTTAVSVRYSQHQPPHSFEVPAGETQVLVVNNPRPGEHSIAFDTPDGTLSGAVRVLLSDAPIP